MDLLNSAKYVAITCGKCAKAVTDDELLIAEDTDTTFSQSVACDD
jgi:hypothetical protein